MDWGWSAVVGALPGHPLAVAAAVAAGDVSDVESIARRYAWLLMGAALVGMLALRANVPYAVALVVGAVVAEQTGLIAGPTLDPDLLLFGLLPPLLFDAAFRVDERELRVLFRPVLALAVPGVLIATVLVGGVLTLVLDLSFTAALLFGSIVAATDPVAVLAVFKHLHVPARLEALAEGESLINGGTAITLYVLLLGLVVSGEADALDGVLLFAREVGGGVLIGAALGFVFSRLTRIVDDHQIEMMLSTALAYGSYLVAQSVDSSGPLACVAAGLLHGSYGRRVGMTPGVHRLLDDLWEYLGFLANAVVFLLLGFTVDLGALRAEARAAGVAVVAVLAARAVVTVLTALAVPNDLEVIHSHGERVVLVWSGLRGALTAALALALPPETPSRDLLIAMAFGVVLFSLVVQGLTLPLVIRWSGVSRPRQVGPAAALGGGDQIG